MTPIRTVEDVAAMPARSMIPLWLAAAYCYEIEAETLIPDACFDALSARMFREWDALPDPCGHKSVIDEMALMTSTASYLKPADYPPKARGLASTLLRAWQGIDVGYRALPPGQWANAKP